MRPPPVSLRDRRLVISMTSKKKIRVTAKRKKDAATAKVMERMLNQPGIIKTIERRMEMYFQAIFEGKSEREAQVAAGLDPDKPAITYDKM